MRWARTNASWRAGFYYEVRAHAEPADRRRFWTAARAEANLTEMPEHTVFGLYAQAISLNKLTYFGLGPSTNRAGRSFYGMTETIVGGNVVKPFSTRLHASLYGELNGRFVNLRGAQGEASPSIEQLYTEATAPGLTTQPATLQLGEGLRIRPIFAADVVRLNYSLAYQQYVAPAKSSFSFRTTEHRSRPRIRLVREDHARLGRTCQ